MALQWLDHVNIRTSNLQPMRDFYADILGLDEGPRPDFGFGGYWLYCGERAAVHLVQTRREPKGEDPKVEHFAFRSDDIAGTIGKLEANGIDYTVLDRSTIGVVQVNLYDPDGNHIELAYAAEEAPHIPDHAREKTA